MHLSMHSLVSMGNDPVDEMNDFMAASLSPSIAFYTVFQIG